MGFGHTIKEFIWKMDFFVTAQVLRVNSEPDYKTLTGGITSITIIIALLATFYNKVIGTFDKVLISSALDNQHFDDPTLLTLSTYEQGKFMFGVEVWHHDLNIGNRFFDVVLKHTYYIDGVPQLDHNKTKTINLQPCTRQHWAGFPQVIQKYDRIRMYHWQCLPKNATFDIYGKFSSKQSMTLDVSVMQCTNSSDNPRPCASPEEIDALFQENGNFYYTIYFLNALINPASHQYLTFYLEDSNYIMFDRNGGQEAQIWIQDFTITTDQSIIPFSQETIQTGGVITKNAIKNRYNTVNGLYGTFFLFKSPTSQVIDRSFQKIDEILAYIGGLFGTITMALFMLSKYNEYSFEIAMASYLYDKNDSNNEKDPIYKKYNFGYFLAQRLYGILQSFKFKPDWPKVKQFHICSQQMIKQLDLLYLLKRINFLERSMELLIEDHQIKGLHLMKQLTLDEARQIRMKYKAKPKAILEMRIKQKQMDRAYINATNPKQNKIHQPNSNIDPYIINNVQKSRQQIKESQGEIEDPQIYTEQVEYILTDGIIKEQSLLEVVSTLQKERKNNVLSYHIWNNIDHKIRDAYSKLKVKQQMVQSIENDCFFEQENITNPNLKFNNQKSDFLNNESPMKTQREKKNILPKLNRLNIRRLNQFGHNSISLMSQKQNSLSKIRIEEEHELQRYE